MGKVAICTGASGQDGSFLCELLLSKPEYDLIIGVNRRSTRENNNMAKCTCHPSRYKDVTLDITDTSGVRNLINQHQPDEVFQLAAMSQVGQSFKEPITTLDIDGRAHIGFLEAIRHEKPDCRLYFAATSELFGNNHKIEELSLLEDMESLGDESMVIHYQDETTPFNPRSPYAAAKLYAYHMTRLYREAFDLFACSGILFNHESPRRGLDFVTRKITNGVARIKLGLQDKIYLGNLNTYRDFGHSKDYVRVMWLMLQQDKPDDYVIATGVSVKIRDILKFVCELADLNWEEVYEVNPEFMRPADVYYLCGDARKAREKLGWKPEYTWKDTLTEMYESDLRFLTSKVSTAYV